MSTQRDKQKYSSPGSESNEKSQGKKTFMLFLRTAMAPSDDTTLDLNTDARLLFDAIRKGKAHMIRFILDASPVDLTNSTDIKGKTPLMVCCQIKEESRRSLAVRLLLANGANINMQDDDGRTVLSHACEMRCNDVVDTLVKHGSIDPDIPDNKGNTSLMYCSMVGNDVAMDILLRSFRRLGLAIEAQNTDGFNALLIAAKYANIACAKLLVEGRAALHHRDSIKGLTAQEWLKKNGYSVEDITPLAMRLRSRAKLLKALNIARISIPSRLKQELNLSDDEDENANITKLSPSSIDNPLASKINPLDSERKRDGAYLPRQFRISESLCNEAVNSETNPGIDYEIPVEELADVSGLHIHGAVKPTTRKFKTCCSDKTLKRSEILSCTGSMETSAELPRWKPHFSVDHYSFEAEDELDDVLFGGPRYGSI